MAIWGVLSACTTLTHNFAGLLLCRFLLGFAESVFLPGAVVSLPPTPALATELDGASVDKLIHCVVLYLFMVH